MLAQMFANEWMRRTLIRVRSAQTEHVEIGYKTSDFGSQGSRSSATNVEVQIDMGARRHAWGVESCGNDKGLPHPISSATTTTNVSSIAPNSPVVPPLDDISIPHSISPTMATSNDLYLKPQATTISPAMSASSVASTPPLPRKTMDRGAPKTLNKSIRKRGEIVLKLIAMEWKRKTLIRNRSSQTDLVEVGYKTSDSGSQVNRSSATNVEVQIDMGAGRHALGVESQVNQNSPMNIREQAVSWIPSHEKEE
ncbi:MAG: hypothetical protein GY696_11750 [Gammaproteobacteria bacterium]|nr:hypothetical protein [Gammaproteobacteria bacterium]